MEQKLDLNEIREEINHIDKELVELLEKRFNVVIKVALYKKENNMAIFDEEREKQVVENCKEQLKDDKYEKHLEKVYIQIMNTCKDIQKKEIILN